MGFVDIRNPLRYKSWISVFLGVNPCIPKMRLVFFGYNPFTHSKYQPNENCIKYCLNRCSIFSVHYQCEDFWQGSRQMRHAGSLSRISGPAGTNETAQAYHGATSRYASIRWTCKPLIFKYIPKYYSCSQPFSRLWTGFLIPISQLYRYSIALQVNTSFWTSYLKKSSS